MATVEAPDLTTDLYRAIKGITCGIAPHEGGMESEEYRAVPINLRNRNGLAADDVAAILAAERPDLGIESENDLLEALSKGTRVRRQAREQERRERAARSYKPIRGGSGQPERPKGRLPAAVETDSGITLLFSKSPRDDFKLAIRALGFSWAETLTWKLEEADIGARSNIMVQLHELGATR